MSKERNEHEKTCLRGIGFIASGSGDANTSCVDVSNGRILRIRPLHYDWKYDKAGFNPWKMEFRGKAFEPTLKSLIPPYSLSYKKRVYSPNRILYPLKRVDWNPDGERHPETRGASKYTRISWDEALDIVTREILRIKEQYGTTAILSQSDGHGETQVVHGPHGCFNKLLGLLGGFTLQARNADSWEGWYWGAKHVWGCEPVGQMEPTINAMPDIAENSKLLLFWGCDPETTPWGFDGQMSSRLCYWFSELGIKFIYICPDLNYGAAVHADRWIPIRPCTDAALQLAIAHLWITEVTYDKEYITSHSVGFEKFEDYVLGKEDGIPKTPGWAAEITGIPSRIIKALARGWASRTTSIAHGNGGPGIRGPYSSENGRLEVLLLAMQGLGKPGVHQVKMLEWGRRNAPITDPMPLGTITPKLTSVYRGALYAVGPRQKGEAAISENLTEVPTQIIPKDLIHDALLNPPISWYGTTLSRSPVEDQFTRYTYPVEGCPEVRMIWTDSPCWITCWNDSNSYIKALRNPKIEFILAQHPWLENDCLFADLILPADTKFEEEDIQSDCMSGQYRLVYKEQRCVEPVGESMSDYRIACAIAERLGLLEEFTGGKTVEDIIRDGYDSSGIEDLITYEELNQKQYFMIPTDPNWKKYPAGLSKFCGDPENNPLSTPSGKIEFYSQRLAEHFPDDRERPPVPRWIQGGPGWSHDENLASKRARDYPLLCMSNHPRWRVHANHDDISWTREIRTCKVTGPDGYKYEPAWMHPSTAGERGIRDGDVVDVYNERGHVLCGAYITERIMPGVVYVDHGARYDPIIPGVLDRGGAINTICPHNTTSKYATGMAVSGFLVEVEKANIDGLRKRYPEAFSRYYHHASGLQFERVLDNGGKSR